MPIPMKLFTQVAVRHGVAEDDEEAVDQFFLETLHKLPPEQQISILDELLGTHDRSLDSKG